MGKRLLKVFLGIVVVLALGIGGPLLYIDRRGIPRYAAGRIQLKVDVTPLRVGRGRRTVQLPCASCHLDNDTASLAGKPMQDLPAQFGSAHSANITRDGRYTPPWMVKLAKMADEDVLDVIAFLRSDDPLVRPIKAKRPASQPSLLTKILARVAFTPLAYPKTPILAPDPGDMVAYGRYLVQGRAMCFPCHSADFAKVDDFVPEKSAGYLGGGIAMPDMNGRIVMTANITPDPETGIGKWTEDEFVRLLRSGVRPDNTVVYKVVDAEGLELTATAFVNVPHDQGQ